MGASLNFVPLELLLFHSWLGVPRATSKCMQIPCRCLSLEPLAEFAPYMLLHISFSPTVAEPQVLLEEVLLEILVPSTYFQVRNFLYL